MIGRMLLRFSPIALVLVAAACGGGGGTKTVTVTRTVTQTVDTRKQVAVRVYFVRDGKVAPVRRMVPSRDSAYLLLALEDGPNATERHAGLTTALTTGPGIPTSRLGLAEVVYTLSQFDPSKPVSIGTNAYTQVDFEDETPAILVESPLPFQAVRSPLHAMGTANTFEATFDYDLIGPDGKLLAHHVVTATSGSGIRGTFDVTIPFAVARAGAGKLVVYELSAKDGSRIHQVEIPLRFEP
jgi:Immunoglobulin-like domain of bacterial spore germination